MMYLLENGKLYTRLLLYFLWATLIGRVPLKQNCQVRNDHRVCILSTWEAEAWNQESKGSQGYIARAYLQQLQQKKYPLILIFMIHSLLKCTQSHAKGSTPRDAV